MSARFRCSERSAERDEPLAGTASTVRAFLLVECPGAWGADAVHQNGLPREVMHELSRRARHHGVRLLMIRRHGRSRWSPATVFAAYAEPHAPWLERAAVTEPKELLDIDLAALGAGLSPGLEPHEQPLFLVCTHGKHDVCCAEQGRPVAAELTSLAPEQTWEVSHIGGDRFAGNVLVLPDGLYYGRVTPAAVAGLVQRQRDGELDLSILRGRCGYPFAVQAAEIYLRRATGRFHAYGLRLVSTSAQDALTTAVFEDDQERRWSVRVRSSAGEPDRLTCQAVRPNLPTRHELVGIEQA